MLFSCRIIFRFLFFNSSVENCCSIWFVYFPSFLIDVFWWFQIWVLFWLSDVEVKAFWNLTLIMFYQILMWNIVYSLSYNHYLLPFKVEFWCGLQNCLDLLTSFSFFYDIIKLICFKIYFSWFLKILKPIQIFQIDNFS